jgi:hypothetical protein
MARAKKRSDASSEGLLSVPWLGSFSGLGGWLPGLDVVTRLLPSLALPGWVPVATRSQVAELHDRLIRLERRLAEHERTHAPARGGRQSLSA